ncbi:MAG: tRNA (uridine(34)/cytosine(34)/5-carboxymethylaminomethyluridine(34)-2'-O)-methyltransferase TrmL [Clostridia bacterium]|nr:tRNA (uridine(34)/cytosine(34)/5-carboxymethylaminomethyluridine(34)-2'-O)-methyltransferase TrmL [Clostridia bacterium]
MILSNINIVLIEPEIPQNTGNIARTCAATGASLHLVEPMGFKVDDRKLKRAGLDYWHELDITYYKDINDFFEKNKGEELYYFTTKAPQCYSDVKYPERVFLVFGKETKGLPEELLYNNRERCVRMPMRENLRSLNLSNTVAIAVYEAFRQRGFEGLIEQGQLTQYQW